MKNKLLERLGKEKLISEFELIKSIPKIAEKYAVSLVTVYSAYQIIDFKVVRDSSKIFASLTKEKLEQDYCRLQSCKKIAQEYGVSGEQIRSYLQKFNINYNIFEKYKADEDFFSRDAEESFYIAGFIAADGSINDKRNTIGLDLAISDIDQLVMIKRLWQAENPIYCYRVKNKGYEDSFKCELVLSSKKMIKDLERFNIGPRKSLINTFPIHLADYPFIHHFMRGYFDGDGSFYNQKSKANFTTQQSMINIKGTPEFLGAYRLILDSQVFKDTKQYGYSRMVGKIGDLSYGGNDLSKRFSQFIYKDATVYMDRKFEKVKHLV